jgi:hypothetical protein
MRWVDAVVPVENLRVLDPECSSVKFLLPPLPVEILVKALELSRAVFDFSRSEVCLLLYYSEEAGYQLTVPKQEVWPGGINYDVSEQLRETMCVGTIHSHGEFEAGHSIADFLDEEFMDGIHITLGDINRYPRFSLSAEIVVNGNRFPVDLQLFEGLISQGKFYRTENQSLPAFVIPPEWLQVIQHRNFRKESADGY